MPVEIASAQSEHVAEFFKKHQREALKTLYDFTVIWHEQAHEFSATLDGQLVGAATIRIAASLAHVERVVVDPAHRRKKIGSALLDRVYEVANYYNCHKLTLLVPHNIGFAQPFFEANGYHVEAVLPQHTFKLDMAVMRKFLL